MIKQPNCKYRCSFLTLQKIVTVITVALAATIPVAAHAKSAEAFKPFAVKLGGLYAGKGAEENTFTRQSNSNTQTYFGVSYERYSKSRTLPIAYGVYFDDIAEIVKRPTASTIPRRPEPHSVFPVGIFFKRPVAH